MSATLTHTAIPALGSYDRPIVSRAGVENVRKYRCATSVTVRQAGEKDIQVLWEHCRALADYHGVLDSFSLSPESLAQAFKKGTISGILATDGISVSLFFEN